MKKEIFEHDWEQCPYCEESYYEYDTGYREYDCKLISQLCGRSYNCEGGEIDSACPLAFKYTVER